VTLPASLLAAIARRPEHERDELVRKWVHTLRETDAAAERIRAQVAAARCRCELPAPVEHGRCSRCHGRRDPA
jgi:hypothetical protein